MLHMVSASTGEVVSHLARPSPSWLSAVPLADSRIEQAACLVRVPTEVVKQRSQTSAKGTPGGSWAMAQNVWRTYGVRGFYRGFGSTVAREVRDSCLYGVTRLLTIGAGGTDPVHMLAVPAVRAAETIPRATENTDRPRRRFAGDRGGRVWEPRGRSRGRIDDAARRRQDADHAFDQGEWRGTSPVCAPARCPGKLTALDRTLLPQATASPSPSASLPSAPTPASTSFPTVLRQIYTEEGIRALFAGVVPRVIWISAGGAVFLGVYESSKKALQGRAAGLAALERERRD